MNCSLQEDCYTGDKMRIQQVLTNLLSNACKFTDPGGTVVLSVEERSSVSGKAEIYFSVKDNGIGIRREDITRIFASFEQLENSNQRGPGTGLGLSISSKMVELMGGRLQVESTYGAGSEFYFHLCFLYIRENCRRRMCRRAISGWRACMCFWLRITT